MSIIYEALKKVESQGKQGQVKDKGRALNRAPALLLVLGVILVVLFGIWYLPKVFNALRRHAELKIKDRQDRENKSMEAQVMPPAPGGAPVAPALGVPKYTLEGIIYDQETPLAIINGLILRKQDKIDDWEVVDITSKEVELMNIKDKTVYKLGL